jgi:hypothetical protein
MALGSVPMKHASYTATVAFALLAIACGEGNGGAACLPEDVERCSCADGRPGFRVCDPAAGKSYGACICDVDASPYLPQLAAEGDGGDGGEAAGGGLTFLSPCDPSDDMCAPGTSCDSFPAKGPHCSKPCKVATDCPPPSPGCNMMGVCKAP